MTLQAGTEWNILRMFEAVLKSASVVVSFLILICGIYIFSSHFPEEWMELVVQTVFLHIIKYPDFIDICHKVGPYVIVDRDYNLGSQCLCHTENIYRGHLVCHTHRNAAQCPWR